MVRRELLRVLGAGVGVAALGGAGLAAQDREEKGGKHDETSEKAVRDLGECSRACSEGLHHCLMQLEAGKREFAKSARICMDCGEICGVTAGMVARKSPILAACCEAAAKASEQCASTCENLEGAPMKEVVEACRKAARSAREVAGSSAGPREKLGN